MTLRRWPDGVDGKSFFTNVVPTIDPIGSRPRSGPEIERADPVLPGRRASLAGVDGQHGGARTPCAHGSQRDLESPTIWSSTSTLDRRRR